MRPNGFIKFGTFLTLSAVLAGGVYLFDFLSEDDTADQEVPRVSQPAPPSPRFHQPHLRIKSASGSFLPQISAAIATVSGESEISEDVRPTATAPRNDSPVKTVALSALKIPPYVMSRILEEQGAPPIANEPRELSNGGGGGRSKAALRTTQSADTKTVTNNESTNGPGPWSYKAVLFLPGLMNNGEPIITNPDIAIIAPIVAGPPDYSLDTKSVPSGKVRSLGNGGVMVLEVVDGYIVDGAGPDFIVFENPFVYKNADGDLAVYAETAVVSVAEVDDPSRYRSFPCNSTSPPYSGCAGVTPVRYSASEPLDQVGGDLFDLSQVGLQKIKFIRIEDTGENQSFSLGTEGFDLDALGLIHTAY